MIEEIWKQIPIAHNYEASSLGRIRKTVNGEKIVVRTFECKTTKGTYFHVSIRINEGFYIRKPVHQLVCLAFHGYPPVGDKPYEPDHINTNKHDNRAENLEWVTRQENVLRAFRAGICQVGLRVEATNIVTGETRKYHSFSEMARQWNTSRHLLRTIVAIHKYPNNPYKGEWVFTVDDSSDKALQRHQANEVICKDYITGKLLICRDAHEMGVMIDVQPGTIVTRTRPTSKLKDRLLSNYVFKRLDDKSEWPNYTIEEALASRESYLENLKKGKYTSCIVKNYITGKEEHYKTITEAAIVIYEDMKNVTLSTVIKMLIYRLQRQQLTLYYGYGIKKSDDVRPWPEYSEDEIALSRIPKRS